MLTVSRDWDRVWWSTALLSVLLAAVETGWGAVEGRCEKWPEGNLRHSWGRRLGV